MKKAEIIAKLEEMDLVAGTDFDPKATNKVLMDTLEDAQTIENLEEEVEELQEEIQEIKEEMEIPEKTKFESYKLVNSHGTVMHTTKDREEAIQKAKAMRLYIK